MTAEVNRRAKEISVALADASHRVRVWATSKRIVRKRYPLKSNDGLSALECSNDDSGSMHTDDTNVRAAEALKKAANFPELVTLRTSSPSCRTAYTKTAA